MGNALHNRKGERATGLAKIWSNGSFVSLSLSHLHTHTHTHDGDDNTSNTY